MVDGRLSNMQGVVVLVPWCVVDNRVYALSILRMFLCDADTNV